MEAKALEHERLLALSAGDAALKHAIAAAELYMHVMGTAKGTNERAKLARKCNDLLALAERLKANARTAAVLGRPPMPECMRQLPAAEKIILLRSSRLYDHKFPPWEAAPGPDAFASPMADGEAFFSDPFPFSLSVEQKAIFAGWKRPADLFPFSESDDPKRDWFVQANAESDLAQDLATDCSVVASLCAAVRRTNMGLGSRIGSLLSTLIYPFDHDAMRPRLSPNGKYVFRLNFNGCWRHVAIDDRLPSSSTDRSLFVVDKRNPRLVWPALVEKAYLKIRGGYDFPGSNSGTDLYVLTGWIPEQIFLQSDDFEPDKTWDRIMGVYKDADAFVTLGTGNISAEEEKALGIVKEHDYAVLDLKVEAGNRLLLVKNPWCDSLVWTGVSSSATVKAQTAQLRTDREAGIDRDMNVNVNRGRLTNTFWLSYEDVMQHFVSLYVNWNPGLFTYRQDHHFTWQVPDATTQLVYTNNPQYSVASAEGGAVWMLLSRHWQDGELEMLRQRNMARKASADGGDTDTLAHVSKQSGFMSLAVYDTSPSGHRVLLPEMHKCKKQGPFVDSPNTLLRFDTKPNRAFTLVVAQAGLPLPTYSFSLSFFSHEPLSVTRATDVLPHHLDMADEWTWSSAGGSAAHHSYVDNPQWALTVTRRTPISLLLSAERHDLPVHVALLYSGGGKRVGPGPMTRDAIAASLEYRRGCNTASAPEVDPGTYTLVASTYEPNQVARFTLRVSAAAPISATRVPSDYAGRLRISPPGGPAVFGLGQERLRAAVQIDRLTRLGMTARSVRLSSPSDPSFLAAVSGPASSTSSLSSSSSSAAPYAIRIALEMGTGPRRAVLASSSDEGEFADASLGLRTTEINVTPTKAQACGGLWLVVERIGSRPWAGQGIEVEIRSDSPGVRLGDWVVAD